MNAFPLDPGAIATSLSRRSVLQAAWSLGMLGGCAQAPIGPRHHDVDLDRLLASMSEKFPMRRKVYDGLDLTLGLPRLSLRPDENRLATSLDVVAEERLLSRRQYPGLLGFSSALRYEPKDRSVRLAQVKIEQFRIDALTALIGSQANRLGAWVTQDLLEDLSVYRIPDSALEFADLLGVQPSGLKVVPNGLRILLEPVRR